MKTIKKILLAFCVAFTVVTLFSSFSRDRKAGDYFSNIKSASYGIDEVVQHGQRYIVVTTDKGGISICKE